MRTARVKSNQPPPKARMNFRLDPEIKARVIRAAAITGQEVTDFAVSTLSEKANQVIEDHNAIILSQEEYEFFLRVIDSRDTKPSKKSRAAAREYRKGGRKGAKYYFAD